MKDVTIRRVIAFIIDYALFCFIFALAVIVILTMTLPLWEENGNMIFTIMLYMICAAIVLLWIYFFIVDYYTRLDLGKRIVRIELLSYNQRFGCSMAFKHSVSKMLASFIWPISIGYYFIKRKMIYDECLGITIKDKVSF